MAKQPSTPPIPDPTIAIKAQAQQNRITTKSPFGTTTFNDNGVPVSTVTRTDTLSPSQQRQFDARNSLGESLLGIAQRQIPQFNEQRFKFQTSNSGQNETFNRQVDLLKPQFQQQKEQLQQELANRGIPIGSELSNNEIQRLSDNQGRTLAELANKADTTGFAQATSARQTNFNELAALLGGQQLTPQNVQTERINTQGAFNAAQAQAQSNFQSKSQQASDFNSGLFSLAGAGVGNAGELATLSDRRLKKNIKRIGTHAKGFGLYLFDYIWGEASFGVMADEVKKVIPEAVIRHSSGFYMVDYGVIGRA